MYCMYVCVFVIYVVYAMRVRMYVVYACMLCVYVCCAMFGNVFLLKFVWMGGTYVCTLCVSVRYDMYVRSVCTRIMYCAHVMCVLTYVMRACVCHVCM